MMAHVKKQAKLETKKSSFSFYSKMWIPVSVIRRLDYLVQYLAISSNEKLPKSSKTLEEGSNKLSKNFKMLPKWKNLHNQVTLIPLKSR